MLLKPRWLGPHLDALIKAGIDSVVLSAFVHIFEAGEAVAADGVR